MNDNIKCPKCGSNNTAVSVKMDFYMPSGYASNVCKSDLRKKEIELMSADWNKADFLCNDCFHTWGHSYNKGSGSK